MCPQVVLLDESDIALFAFKITIHLKQFSPGGAILTTLRHDSINVTNTFVDNMNCENLLDCEPPAAIHEKFSP